MAGDSKDSRILDGAVRKFVERELRGIEQLELLMLLHREPTRYFDSASAAQSLQLSARDVAGDLEALSRRGLLDVRIASVVLYRFSPATPALAEAVEQLVDAYRNRRGELIELLAAARRRQTLKDFSNAFRLKKDPEDG
jgi:hypothetical protein